MDHTHDDL